MKTRPAAMLAGSLAASMAATMLLAGCGGDPKPDASATTATATTTASPTTATPTTSASPTTAPKVDPNIPSAARAHTPAGAEAFVRYFFAQVNQAWQSPEARQIARLGLVGCKTCEKYESAVAGMISKNQHYEGEAFTLSSAGSLGVDDVLVVGAQKPGKLIASDGSVVDARSDTDKAKFIASLSWSASGWRVAEIRVTT